MWYLKRPNKYGGWNYLSSAGKTVETVSQIRKGARAFETEEEAQFYKKRHGLKSFEVTPSGTYIHQFIMAKNSFTLVIWISKDTKITKTGFHDLNQKERNYFNEYFSGVSDVICHYPSLGFQKEEGNKTIWRLFEEFNNCRLGRGWGKGRGC